MVTRSWGFEMQWTRLMETGPFVGLSLQAPLDCQQGYQQANVSHALDKGLYLDVCFISTHGSVQFDSYRLPKWTT